MTQISPLDESIDSLNSPFISLSADSSSSASTDKPDSAALTSARSTSVFAVSAALFVDALLYTIPLSFLPVLLQDFGYNDFEIGVIFSMKAAVQILFTPFSGFITNRFGPRLPLCIATCFVIFSTLLFGFTPLSNYPLLCIARGLQGIGSSAAFSSGMAHLSEMFSSDAERGNAMGTALAGVGLSIIIAPPLGAVLYHYTQLKSVPFLFISGLSCLLLILLIYSFYFHPHLKVHAHRISVIARPSYFEQIRPLFDPIIATLLLQYSLLNAAVAMLEFLLPLHIDNEFHSSTLVLGAVFLPSTIGYLLFTPLSGRFGPRIGRVTVVALGMLSAVVVMSTIGLPDSLWAILIIQSGIGIGFGLIDGCLPSMLANLIDFRHGSHVGYGIVFSGSDASICIGLLFGSFAGSALANSIGFRWSTRLAAALMMLAIPLLYFVLPYERLIQIREKENTKIAEECQTNKLSESASGAQTETGTATDSETLFLDESAIISSVHSLNSPRIN